MAYQVKIIYPKEEAAEGGKLTERTLSEYVQELETADVLTQYEQLQTRGYSITATFQPPEEDATGEDNDPFAIAGRLELAGIPYRATLKLKAAGPYENMAKLVKLIEAAGFDYDISVKLKIRETSPVDFEKEGTWFDKEYAKYTVLPKAAVQDIAELRSLYDQLVEEHQKVSITIKAKVPKDDDDSFANQLAAYPADTLIVFKLSDAELYDEE